MEKNDMAFWYPRIEKLNILMPKTKIVPIVWAWDKSGNSIVIKNSSLDFMNKEAKKFKFPLFIRGSHLSGKHDWKETCYVLKFEDLKRNATNIVWASIGACILGIPCTSIVLREYIPMKNLFTAFYGDMPVNPEIRFFVKDGEILCKHWYWIEDAIYNPSIDNWKDVLKEEKENISENELHWLYNSARKVAKLFKGYWSIDFCKAKNGKWVLIDMALGEDSWHPKCEITQKHESEK